MNNTQEEFLERVTKMNLIKYTSEIAYEYDLHLSMKEVKRVAKILFNLSLGYVGKLNYLGKFTGYVYKEDFMKAFNHADDTNIRALLIYMHFIKFEVPINLRIKKS